MADSGATITAGIDHAAQAARLRQAYSGQTIPPLRDLFADAAVEDAYAIQALNTAHWLGQGRRRIGAKIGLTAKAVQAQLGVDQPDFGTLFADMAVANGGSVAPGRLIQPKVEAEIAFILARSPDPEAQDLASLSAAVAQVLPAIEIVDSRIESWNIGIVDTVADNASSGLFVLGEPIPLGAMDLSLCGMVLDRNGAPVSLGVGAACLGNPLNALGWLARKMAGLGSPLVEGDIVLAGALGPMVTVEPGDLFEASIDRIGSVRVRFEA